MDLHCGDLVRIGEHIGEVNYVNAHRDRDTYDVHFEALNCTIEYVPGALLTLVPKPPRTVTLTLTEAEARTLVAIQYRTGGSPTNSPRGHMDRISHVIQDELGVDCYSGTVPEAELMAGQIVFGDYEKENA